MCESRHQGLGQQVIRSERIHHRRLRINPNAGLRGGYGIAVIGVCEKRCFRKQLAPAGRVEDHEMVIDGAADEAKPTAFDLVDRRRSVPLLEQELAGSKIPDNAPGFKQRRQFVESRHRLRAQAVGGSPFLGTGRSMLVPGTMIGICRARWLPWLRLSFMTVMMVSTLRPTRRDQLGVILCRQFDKFFKERDCSP